MACGRRGADAGQLGERAGGEPLLELALGQSVYGRGGRAERLHPVARLVGPLEQERDLPQRSRGRDGRLRGARHATLTATATSQPVFTSSHIR